ncbi:hypothetical protein H2198_004967 [Neophaeococcomyces mojaviensis]|uniref:Uncharacterized protein n=1 Tax=Neophaeococcomyces mojaviensis TaxID=3383035 RepID=A0ACC3A703_9EURO|nr:hypothetical protein H2198_004967 [Knufia sp. JES_112]
MVGEHNPNSTKYMSGPNLKIEIIPTTELFNPLRKSLLHNLNDLLNDAYIPTDLAAIATTDEISQPVFSRSRIQHEDQLAQELGTDGLIAVCTDTDLSDVARDTTSWQVDLTQTYRVSKYGNLVATASVTPWKGREVERFLQTLKEAKQHEGTHVNDPEVTVVKENIIVKANGEENATWNWEVKTCASCNDPKYRGKGLMVHCVDALVKELLSRQHELGKSSRLKLWITAVDGSANPGYWMRRGFKKEGEADVAPKGLWGSNREFSIQTLSKIIE